MDRAVKLLVTGTSGQVGGDLLEALGSLGEVVGADRRALDLTDLDAIRRVVSTHRPDVLVNAAAYTAVDRAESEPALAHLINGVAPGVMAEELARFGGVLVHYSTDYVFDGTKSTPYLEDDPTGPMSVYGASKLAGEQAIAAVGRPNLIFRTSWVYGNRGRNFLLTIRRLAAERPVLRVVDDQHGAPTWSRWIAETTARCLQTYLSSPRDREGRAGVYHMTAGDETTWFGFAEAIVAAMEPEEGQARPDLVPITSAEYPVPAPRPANSVLSNDKIRRVFGIEQVGWEAQLRACLADRG